jgi:hypothetical protein
MRSLRGGDPDIGGEGKDAQLGLENVSARFNRRNDPGRCAWKRRDWNERRSEHPGNAKDCMRLM